MMSAIKNIIKNEINLYFCQKYHAPLNCWFSRSAQVKNCVFEGRNMVNFKTNLIDSTFGFGTYVAQNSVIMSTKIGRYCAVGFESLLGAHPIHDVASIHPALYSTHAQYGFTYVDRDFFEEYHYADKKENKAIVIGNDVWVTAGATKIVQSITIGDGAVVMADAVVTKNVPPYAIVAGVPAKIIGYRFAPEEIDFLLKLKWWDRGEAWIKSHAQYFQNVKVLINKVLQEEPDFWNK